MMATKGLIYVRLVGWVYTIRGTGEWYEDVIAFSFSNIEMQIVLISFCGVNTRTLSKGRATKYSCTLGHLKQWICLFHLRHQMD